MKAHQQQLASRRAMLLDRSEQLRLKLSSDGRRLRQHVSGVDRGISIARTLSSRPLLMGAAAVALIFIRPGRAIKWVARGALITSMLRKVVGLVDHGRPARSGLPTRRDD